MPRSPLTVFVFAGCCAAAIPAHAALWNDCGHRVVAAIAFEEMRPAARRAIVALLREHPAAVDPTFWAAHENNGDDPDLNLFMNAAIFPDEARRPGPFKRFDIGPAHYINYRLVVDQTGETEVLPPLPDRDPDFPHDDILESLETNVAIARDRSADPEDRAVALSWIMHQVGDLHQPLHTVARFCPATPNGDRGGNDVKFGKYNLHSTWDYGIGGDSSPENVRALAERILAEHPRPEFKAGLGAEAFAEWTREGVQLAIDQVYRDLDPNLDRIVEPPIGYNADLEHASRQRVAQAGYRLADLLTSIVAAPSSQSADVPSAMGR